MSLNSRHTSVSSISKTKKSQKPFWKRRGFKSQIPKIYDSQSKSLKPLPPLYRVRRNKLGMEKRDISSSRSSSEAPSSISDYSELSSQFSTLNHKNLGSTYNAFGSSNFRISDTVSLFGTNTSTQESSLTQGKKLDDDDIPVVFVENPFGKSTTTINSMDDSKSTGEEFIDDIQENRGITVPNQEEEPVELSEKYVEMIKSCDFEITLKETKTFFLFDQLDSSVGKFDPQIDTVVTNNKRFEMSKKKKERNPDKFTEHYAQTLESFYDNISKNKTANTKDMYKKTVGIGCTEWKMIDEIQEIQKKEEEERLESLNLNFNNPVNMSVETITEEDETEELSGEEESDEEGEGKIIEKKKK